MADVSANGQFGDYIDLDEGLGRVRGNKTLYQRMLGLFTQSEEFDAFEKALSENDLPRASEVMHGIKGMTGNLSLTRVYKISSELTNHLRNGVLDQNEIAEYRDALEKTRACVNELMTQLT